MSDPIDREQALSAFDTDDNELVIRGSENADAVEQYLKKVMGKIENLPPAQPEFIKCDYIKACNEVTTNKTISAWGYLAMLGDFEKLGYVLVKRRG